MSANEQLDTLQSMRNAVVRCAGCQLEVDRVIAFRHGLPKKFMEKLRQADIALEAVGSLLHELESEAWQFTRIQQQS